MFFILSARTSYCSFRKFSRVKRISVHLRGAADSLPTLPTVMLTSDVRFISNNNSCTKWVVLVYLWSTWPHIWCGTEYSIVLFPLDSKLFLFLLCFVWYCVSLHWPWVSIVLLFIWKKTFHGENICDQRFQQNKDLGPVKFDLSQFEEFIASYSI